MRKELTRKLEWPDHDGRQGVAGRSLIDQVVGPQGSFREKTNVSGFKAVFQKNLKHFVVFKFFDGFRGFLEGLKPLLLLMFFSIKCQKNQKTLVLKSSLKVLLILFREGEKNQSCCDRPKVWKGYFNLGVVREGQKASKQDTCYMRVKNLKTGRNHRFLKRTRRRRQWKNQWSLLGANINVPFLSLFFFLLYFLLSLSLIGDQAQSRWRVEKKILLSLSRSSSLSSLFLFSFFSVFFFFFFLSSLFLFSFFSLSYFFSLFLLSFFSLSFFFSLFLLFFFSLSSLFLLCSSLFLLSFSFFFHFFFSLSSLFLLSFFSLSSLFLLSFFSLSSLFLLSFSSLIFFSLSLSLFFLLHFWKFYLLISPPRSWANRRLVLLRFGLSWDNPNA